MNRILLLDTETTGLDHSRDCPIEVAWAVYSIDDAAVLSARSMLVDALSYRETVGEVADTSALTGITSRMWARGETWGDAERMVASEARGCDAVVAHNAPFDRGWFRDDAILGMPWIDTCDAVTWPWPTRSRSLDALQLAAFGFAVAGHRAMADVWALARLLSAASKQVDLRAMLAPAMRPRSLYAVADTSFSEERNRLAKAAGFRWTPEAREWRATLADEDATALPFAVRKVAVVKTVKRSGQEAAQ